MKILNEILEGILPKGKEKEIKVFVKELQARIDKKKIKAKAVLGGSFAKGTFLKDDFDVDIFVRFDKKYKDLSKLLEKCLSGLKYEKVHGSRDYFQINSNYKFEIVPVLKISKPEDALNVTDMSPLHVNWVKRNSDDKLRNDIRLMKKFCKGIGVYGAESYISGFSGHVVDILVIHYGGFLNVLKKAVKWKDKKIIDFSNYHKGEALFHINKSKTIGPLIVVDPVLPGRNAAAAVGYGKFNIFKKNAERFLKKPSKKFFVIDEFNPSKYKGIVLKLGVLKGKEEYQSLRPCKEFKILHMKEDVIGAKLLKTFDFLMKGLKEFKVMESGWNFEYIWFKVKTNKIDKEYERVGPPAVNKEDVKGFNAKHKKTYVKGKYVCAKIKREFTNVNDKVDDLIKNKYVKEKVKCIRLLN